MHILRVINMSIKLLTGIHKVCEKVNLDCEYYVKEGFIAHLPLSGELKVN